MIIRSWEGKRQGCDSEKVARKFEMVYRGMDFQKGYKKLERFSDAFEFRDAKEKSCGREWQDSSSGVVVRT